MSNRQTDKPKTRKRSKTKKTLPDWATAPFERFLNSQEESDQILHLSMGGISMFRGRPKAIEALALADPEGHPMEDSARQLEQAKKEAEVAQREMDKGFPLLHSQAVVSLWGSLEDLLRTFLATWLANEPTGKQVDAVAKLKVALGEYERMDEEERCLYVVELLERELQSPLRQGVSRFESLLEPFELSGKVGKETQKNIYEMYHVRNVLVHRRGVADRRLTESCPWLGLKVGDPVIVSREMYAHYSLAVSEYVLELIQRVRKRFGLKPFNVERWEKKGRAEEQQGEDGKRSKNGAPSTT